MTESAGIQHDGEAARAQLQAGLPVDQVRLQIGGVSTTLLAGGEGRPIVLLHGPGGHAAHWLRVIPGLVAERRVIAPDLPGHGGSDLTNGPLDGEGMLAWLGELIDSTCPSPPTLVGHGAGGALAARFAAGRSDRIGALVLVDTLGLAPFAPAQEFHDALMEFLAQPSERTHDHLWRYCAFDVDRLREQMSDTWPAFRAYNIDRVQSPSVQAAVGALMEHFAMAPIPHAELARISAPTTLVWGREDLATPVAVAHAASDRYGWPLHVIDDCADDPPVERPEALLEALRAARAAATGPISRR